MKNHAFIIPVHQQPCLLGRILRVLQADNHHFFIHVSGQINNYKEFVNACSTVKNVNFVKRIPVYHCGISQVWATLILLKAVKKSPVHFDYVHQISGQCYPIRSNEQFDDFFEKTEDSFMCFNYDDQMDYWERIYNMHTNWWYSNGTNGVLDKYLSNHVHSRIIHRLFPRKPIKHLAGSWDWFSWSDKVVDFILKEISINKPYWTNKYLRRFNHTVAPGEHIWATLLINHLDELKIHKHFPLRYISWHTYHNVEQKHRPYDMDERDYERIINSAAFFCRKVEEKTSAKLLDMIDAQRGDRYDISEHDYFV